MSTRGKASFESGSAARRLLGFGPLIMLAIGGCNGSTAEKLRAAQLAEGCSLDSDCDEKLICVFSRCHRECEQDRDCHDLHKRCVKGTPDNYCQLEDEVACSSNKGCVPGEVCGVDSKCRDVCTTSSDCTPSQICSASNQCASGDSELDQLDAAGNLVVDGASGAGGTSGGSGAASGGEAGEPETAGAANESSAGDGGATMSGNTGATMGGSAGATTDGSAGATTDGSAGATTDGSAGATTGGNAGATTGGNAGATMGGSSGSAMGGSAGAMMSGSGGAGTVHVETSDGVETVPNNDRDHTVPLVTTASIYLGPADEDWFSVVAPNDGHAHVLTLNVTQAGGARADVRAMASADNSVIGSPVRLNAGVTAQVYVSVGPGTTTYLSLSTVSNNNQGRADLSLTMTPEADLNEPNNTRASAASIGLNSNISAQMIVPFVSASDQVADDWYRLDLAAGAATLMLSSAPITLRVTLQLFDSLGVRCFNKTTDAGQTGGFAMTIPATGTYTLGVIPYASSVPAFASGAKPASLSDSYTFQVQQ